MIYSLILLLLFTYANSNELDIKKAMGVLDKIDKNDFSLNKDKLDNIQISNLKKLGDVPNLNGLPNLNLDKFKSYDIKDMNSIKNKVNFKFTNYSSMDSISKIANSDNAKDSVSQLILLNGQLGKQILGQNVEMLKWKFIEIEKVLQLNKNKILQVKK